MPGAGLPPVLVAGSSRLHAALVAAALTSYHLPARAISPQETATHGRARALVVLGDVDARDKEALAASAGSAPCLLIGAVSPASRFAACIRLSADVGLDEIVALLGNPDRLAEGAKQRVSAPRPGRRQLSPRELDVLRCLADGASNDEIGLRLKMSPHTARTHVANILAKLGTSTRVAAVGIGRRERLL